MSTPHHAIPTRYSGVNFRSRLEAKYASMFDQLGWKWEYEPIDLKGWIPDFVIRGVKPIFVEVKPVWNIDEVEEVGREIERALGLKCDDNGLLIDLPHEALICGAWLPEIKSWDASGIGWLWEGFWSEALVLEPCHRPKAYGLCHSVNSYTDRITGIHSGHPPVIDTSSLDLMWVKAGNLVQWRPR